MTLFPPAPVQPPALQCSQAWDQRLWDMGPGPALNTPGGPSTRVDSQCHREVRKEADVDRRPQMGVPCKVSVLECGLGMLRPTPTVSRLLHGTCVMCTVALCGV